MEERESILNAVIREAKEEADIDIEAKNLSILTCLHRLSGPEREYLDFFVGCSKFKGTITNKEPRKCADLNFYPMDALPPNVAPFVSLALKNALNGISFHELC